jgi:hypothetical protein
VPTIFASLSCLDCLQLIASGILAPFWHDIFWIILDHFGSPLINCLIADQMHCRLWLFGCQPAAQHGVACFHILCGKAQLVISVLCSTNQLGTCYSSQSSDFLLLLTQQAA